MKQRKKWQRNTKIDECYQHSVPENTLIRVVFIEPVKCVSSPRGVATVAKISSEELSGMRKNTFNREVVLHVIIGLEIKEGMRELCLYF